MKFYFCETCGKRLTEEDLAQGAARDKQLKGIYCAECAQGVHTIQFKPVSAPTAQPEQPFSEPLPPGRRRTSKAVLLPKDAGKPTHGLKTPSAAAARVSPNAIHPKGPGPQRNATNLMPMLLFGSSAGVIVIAVAFLVLSSGDGNTRRSAEMAKAVHEKRPDPKLQNSMDLPAGDQLPSASAPIAKSEPAEVVATPTPSRDRLPQPSSVAPTAIEASQTQKPAQANVPPLPAPPPSDPKPSLAPLEPDVEKPKASKPAVPPQIAVEVQNPWASWIEDLDKGDAESTPRLLANPGLTAAQSEALRVITDRIRASEALLVPNLTKKIGTKVKVYTKTAAYWGKLVEVGSDGFSIAREYVINGESRTGDAVKIPLSDLSLDCRRDLAGSEEPSNAESWMTFAIELLIEGQRDRAHTMLSKAEGHPLQKPVLNAFKQVEHQRVETMASESWAKLSVRAESAKSGAEARAIIADLDSYVRTFADTAFALNPEVQAKGQALRKDLNLLLLDADPRLTKAFQGQIESFSARTGELAISYTFKRQEELEDWSFDKVPDEQKSLCKLVPGGLRMSCPNSSNPFFSSNLFCSGKVKLILDYELEPQATGNEFCFLIWLFGDEATAKGTTAVLKATARGISLMRGDMRDSLGNSPEALPAKGTLEVRCIGRQYEVHLNGKKALEYEAPDANESLGIRWGGGFNMQCVIKRLVISGRVDDAKFNARLNSIQR